MPPSHVPLQPAQVENLGFVHDNDSNPSGIFHDGGGGATQNGHHIQIFADSFTESSGFNFVHNSISYFGHANRNPSDPLHQQKCGMRGPPGNRIFTGTQLGAMHEHERALGPAFTIWLINSMTPLPDGRTILGVHPCLESGKPTDADMYSTMVAITAVDPATLRPEDVPPARRLGDGMLFRRGEVQYGNFACVAGIDGWLYLFGADRTGVKLARVPLALGGEEEMDRMADRARFEYYHASASASAAEEEKEKKQAGDGEGQWRKSDEPLRQDDPRGNILDWSINPMGEPLGPDTGDVWFDPYHGTMMMVFMSKFVDGQFWASYAVDGRLEGPWSVPVVLWTSPVPAECKGEACGAYNYQGHAHPGWDPSGRTLLLSYSSCARFVSMAKLTWA